MGHSAELCVEALVSQGDRELVVGNIGGLVCGALRHRAPDQERVLVIVLALVVSSVEHLGVSWREIGHKVGRVGIHQNVRNDLEKTASARAKRISLNDGRTDRGVTSGHVVVADVISEIGDLIAERHEIVSADIVNVESELDLIVHHKRVLHKAGFNEDVVLFGVGLCGALGVYNS